MKRVRFDARRALAAAAVVTGVVAGGLVGVAAPASAAPSCWEFYICTYENASYAGAGYKFWNLSDGGYTDNYFDGSGNNINDRVSSVKQQCKATVKFRQHVGGGGGTFSVDFNTFHPGMGVYGDWASSHYRSDSNCNS